MGNEGKINWLRDTDGKYKKTLRGHSAVITVAANGQATLVIDGGAGTVYTTLKNAKDAFRTYLHNIPVS